MMIHHVVPVPSNFAMITAVANGHSASSANVGSTMLVRDTRNAAAHVC